MKIWKYVKHRLTKLVFFLFVLILLSSFINADLTTDLRAYYNFYNVSTDSSGNNFHITFAGDPVYGSAQSVTGIICDGSNDQGVTDSIPLITKDNMTLSFWIKPDAIQDNSYATITNWNLNANQGFTVEQNAVNHNDYYYTGYDAGTYLGVSKIVSISSTDFQYVVILKNGTNLDWFINGTRIGNSQTVNLVLDKGNEIFYMCDGPAGNRDWGGIITNFAVYDIAITYIQIQLIYNDGVICNIIDNPTGCTEIPINDTTPPVISNIVQFPANLTSLNSVETDLLINATITDNIKVDNSTIYMNISLNDTEIFINGIQLDSNLTLNYNSALGTNYNFILEHFSFLSATYNFNPESFHIEPHLNDTRSGLNIYWKFEFYNVTNNAPQVFMELYDFNNTSLGSLVQYYYCNSSYSTGSVIGSSNCALFFSRPNNQALNHSHELSKHRIIPMNINTSNGQLNGIGVTPISYILKRGASFDQSVSYISNFSRTDVWSYTNNNGNTWNDLSGSGTPDTHIHQFHFNESINYQICALDNSSNKGCSAWIGDTIDFVIFPPSSVEILNPIGISYNDTIIIDHTSSFSQSGFNIVSYKYEYALNNTEIFTTIIENNYPNLNYSWNIESIVNDVYFIRITTTDDHNLTSLSESELFTINNVETITDQLLQDLIDINTQILENSNETKDSILNMDGGFTMLWVIIPICFFLALGFFMKNFYIWWISAGLSLSISLYSIIQANAGINYDFNFGMSITFVILSVLFFVLGIVFQLQFNHMNESKKNEEGYLLKYS